MFKIHLIYLLLISMATISVPLYGQELNANVVINSERVQTTERGIFQDMQRNFASFLNERKWTDDVFQNEERINCNFIITIESMPSIGNFTATVQIQASRPVFNTSYQSLIFNFADRNWNFQYNESQQLIFSENSFNNNITSILAFYAYIIIGLDYDTFSPLGGTPYFNRAQNIVTNAQQSGNQGWDQFESNRNRYWLSENLNSQQMEPVRRALYQYHRQGLDTFIEEEEESRRNILSALENIQEAKKTNPNAILIIAFFDAKNNELVQIFSKGNTDIRQNAYNILTGINPSQTDKYSPMVNQ